MRELRASGEMLQAGRDSVVTQLQLRTRTNNARTNLDDGYVITEVTEVSYSRLIGTHGALRAMSFVFSHLSEFGKLREMA